MGASGEGHNADGKAGDGSSSKAQAKAVAKAVGIALLALLVTADIGGIFFMTNWAMYRALKPEGLQGLLILNSAMSASLLVFILGFATALSTYCLSSAETLMLTLPARPSHVLGAKIDRLVQRGGPAHLRPHPSSRVGLAGPASDRAGGASRLHAYHRQAIRGLRLRRLEHHPRFQLRPAPPP